MINLIKITFYVVFNFLPIVLSTNCEGEIPKNEPFYNISLIVYNNTEKCEKCDSSENICVRKCCGLNYIINNETCVFNNNSNHLDNLAIYENGDMVKKVPGKIRFLPGMIECSGPSQIQQFLPYRNPEDGGDVQSDGRLWMSKNNTFFGFNDYCLDYSEDFGVVYYTCVDRPVPDLTVSEYLYIVGMWISLPFLLITFIIYALLPERNLHAMCLMSHVFAIFMAYLVAGCLIFNRGKWNIHSCRALPMITLCCFMASIFWVNLMAYDIFSTFIGARSASPQKKRDDRRRFIIYNFYAWGIPLLFIALTIIISKYATPNAWYDPGLRGAQCVLSGGVPTLLYYYGPIILLIISNIIMFIITACKIRKAQKDTAMLTRKGSKKHGGIKDGDKQMFQLYIRLLFAMGVNWSFEIIAWALNWGLENVPPAVWYVSEFFNAAYGIAVFILFVCKKNIWRALKKRYYKARGREPTEMSVTASTGMME